MMTVFPRPAATRRKRLTGTMLRTARASSARWNASRRRWIAARGRSNAFKGNAGRCFLMIKNLFSRLRDEIRDFVFGMEDGLVSNLGLVLGVWQGGGGKFAILLAGLASMLTGAFSMSAGSYLAAKSQGEVYEQEIKATKEELKKRPKQCLQEMERLLKEEGFDKNEVKMMSWHFIHHNHSSYTKNFIQKKLGLSEERSELPFRNALMMFFSFLAGSSFPIIPFVLFEESSAAVAAAAATITALFLVGWAKTIFTKRNWFRSGMEIVLVGVGAGALGYLIGYILSLAG